ncbi:hypothetical protein ACFWSF_09550 [Streptomyces sp. NPDC058611]|uniref:hypothetical protein n=1 Tax=unclassified Streptomyces TaxID=2593676 RepID=UPI003657B1A5
MQRAEKLLYALFEGAGDGCHNLTVSTGAAATVVSYHNEGNTTYLGEGVEMADTVAATSLALDGEVCGVVLRTNEEDGTSRVWGWSLAADTATPLTPEELRRAYSINALTGEPVPPVPGVRYEQAPCLHMH